MEPKSFRRLVARATGAQDDEVGALTWGFAWFFFLLLAYYVLRPVRETLGVERGPDGLKWLFTATFIGMLVAVPFYSALVASVGRKRLVPIAYRFFAMNLLLFWFALRTGGETRGYAASAFFVWVSVFNLFAVSIFWSFQADIFSSAQGKRLFGFIAAGGTLGAVFGSLITVELSSIIGTTNLLLIPLVLLEVALFCARRLDIHAASLGASPKNSAADSQGTGGGLFDGFSATFRSPYLRTIAAYTLCNALLGTTVYFQQAEVVKVAIEGEAARTAFFARLNLWVQLATVVIQVLITARLLKAVGVAAALCILPLIYAIGVGALGFAPTLAVLAVVDVVRRAGSYAITTPSREVLFTSLDRTEKYKAKSFLDTVVFRGGDALAGHAFNALRALGAGGLWMAAIMIPIAGAWAWIGHKAGRMHRVASREVELKA